VEKLNSKGVFSVMAAAVLTVVGTAEAQTYKIGDIHPDGGIVVEVDQTGTQGFVVEENDRKGSFSAPAKAPLEAQEMGWGVPYFKNIELVYRNLHKQGIGNFQEAFYQTQDPISGYFAGLQFLDGRLFNDLRARMLGPSSCRAFIRLVRDFPTLKEKVVVGGATWEGDWSWADDDSHGPNHSKLTIKSETEFVYTYADAVYNLQGKIGYISGFPKATLEVHLDLPDGNHLRFEWKSENEVEGQFWPKGQKEGNTPGTVAKMKRVASK
jgi:hypothetical protein